jgi:hypothetical protein
MPLELEITSLAFDCPHNVRDAPGTVLKMAAKRYQTRASAANPAGLTLLFAHCIGARASGPLLLAPLKLILAQTRNNGNQLSSGSSSYAARRCTRRGR